MIERESSICPPSVGDVLRARKTGGWCLKPGGDDCAWWEESHQAGGYWTSAPDNDQQVLAGYRWFERHEDDDFRRMYLRAVAP